MALMVVSYSRIHRNEVRPFVELLKATYPNIKGAVFWDEDFEPGEGWFEQIARAIDEAEQLFLFWCAHAAASEQIRREVGYAMSKHKRIVPVILDDSFPRSTLKDLHGIDLRSVFHHDAQTAATTTLAYRHGLDAIRSLNLDVIKDAIFRAAITNAVRAFAPFLGDEAIASDRP